MILGIDPGKKGAFALLSPSRKVLELKVMPLTIDNEIDLPEMARFMASICDRVTIAYLEELNVLPKNGAFSSRELGRNLGHCEAMLAAFQIPYKKVSPMAWMKFMHLGADPQLPSKARGRQTVERIFPDVNLLATARSKVIHEGLMDALLISEYGRHMEGHAS